MKNIGKTIKQIRLDKQLSQTDIAKDLMSRQFYSKIENDTAEITLSTLQQILKKLNVDITDFLRENLKNTEIAYYQQLLVKGFRQTLTAIEAKELMDYVKDHYTKDNKHLLLYVLTKSHVRNQFPNLIPDITEEDKLFIKKCIFSIKGQYSLFELKLIGDCARFLSISDLKKLFNQFPNYAKKDFSTENSNIRIQINKIYNNFCDLAILAKDIPFANKILTLHKEFAKTYPEIRYLFYIKVNETMITYLETKEISVLLELNKIADMFEYIGEQETAKAIRYQFQEYAEKNSYNPNELITKDV
ncbi:helix-turn-helix domain-containing protein [Enterococcus sp. AZ008]|uniref:helix-turn-helix domain-containing protein n=1 Tax=Enterococcus sp. AZ008 TaxID=2774821 RepID=UPI003F1E99F0